VKIKRRRPSSKPPLAENRPPSVELQLTEFEDTERAADLFRRIIRAQALTLAEREEEERKRNDAA
jgi:hypothetical protein